MRFTLDHLAISAPNLQDGVDWAEELFGVSMAPGGEHPLMGTHNRLLSLGPEIYLEIIAINPEAPKPEHSRWFDLDKFSGKPRLTNWIVRTDDMSDALANAPDGTGEIMELERGDLSWQMAVPVNGHLPFDGAFPALIHWYGEAHPAARLPDHGLRLEALEIEHPEAEALKRWLEPNLDLSKVWIKNGLVKNLSARISGPNGQVVLL